MKASWNVPEASGTRRQPGQDQLPIAHGQLHLVTKRQGSVVQVDTAVHELTHGAHARRGYDAIGVVAQQASQLLAGATSQLSGDLRGGRVHGAATERPQRQAVGWHDQGHDQMSQQGS